MFYLVVGLSMFLMLMIQATLFSVVFPMVTPADAFTIPNLAVVVLIFAIMVRDGRNLLFVAFIIGLIQDIAFGSYVGLYAFTYSYIAYFANLTLRLFMERHILVFLFVVILALFSFELLIWGINSLFGLVDVTLAQAFDRYFWGRLLLGSAIAVIFFRPVMALLERKGVAYYE